MENNFFTLMIAPELCVLAALILIFVWAAIAKGEIDE
ncbi:cytochrome bd oxidase small subunit CydS [Paenibacillus albiflavus]